MTGPMENGTAVYYDSSIDDPSWFYYKYAINGSIGPSGASLGDYGTIHPPLLISSTMKYLPDWTNLIYVVIFFVFIVVTIVGNTLVIAAVITTRRLRSVTNCFVSSLAAADLLVGLAVMPPAVLLYINDGNWGLGEVLCEAWVSLDVLLCTASILSLCAISIDRYLAVTQPLVYSKRRRSKKLAGLMIIAVWTFAGIITSPPLLGYFPRAINRDPEKCGYNIDPSYVVFSAIGSFFLPMLVMLYVYAKISCVIAWRHKSLLGLSAPNDYASHRGRSPLVREPERTRSCFLRTLTVCNIYNVNGPSTEVLQPPAKYFQTYSAKYFQQGTEPSHHQPEEFSSVSDMGAGTSNEIVGEPEAVPDVGPETSNDTVDTGAGTSNEIFVEREGVRVTGAGTSVEIRTEPETRPADSTRDHRAVTSGTENHLAVPSRGTEHESNRSSMRRLMRESKTAGTLAIVVGGFIACWLPFFILYLATPFIPSQPPINLMITLTWLGWINSAINPFIYAFYSKDFRLAFWRLTCRQCFESNISRPSLDPLTDRRQPTEPKNRRKTRPNG